jgi:hypothetical protein
MLRHRQHDVEATDPKRHHLARLDACYDSTSVLEQDLYVFNLFYVTVDGNVCVASAR